MLVSSKPDQEWIKFENITFLLSYWTSFVLFCSRDLDGDTSLDDLPIERRGSLTSLISITTTGTSASDSSSSGGPKVGVILLQITIVKPLS